MELKEFVSETLTQICEGVKDAQQRCADMGALINPMLDVKTCNAEVYKHDGKDYPAKESQSQMVTSVEFAITIEPPYISRDGKHFPLSQAVLLR